MPGAFWKVDMPSGPVFLKQPVSHYTGRNIETPERRQCTPKAKLAGRTRVYESHGRRDTVRLDLRLNKYVCPVPDHRCPQVLFIFQ